MIVVLFIGFFVVNWAAIPFAVMLYYSRAPVVEFDSKFSVGDMVRIKTGGETGQIVCSS